MQAMFTGIIEEPGHPQAVIPDGQGPRLTVAANLAPYVGKKSSVAFDGVSLTVANVADTSFDVALIPPPLEVTTFGQRPIGDSVNIETDIMGSDVECLLLSGALETFRPTDSGSTLTTAAEA